MSLLEAKPLPKISDRLDPIQKGATAVTALDGGWALQLFLRISVCLLLATAAGKFGSATGNSRILDEKDPILWFLSNRNLLLVTGIAELLVVFSLLSLQSISARLSVLLMLCLAFIGYRLSLYLGGFPGSCKCLGMITAAIGLSDETSNRISLGILAFLSLGTGFGMIALRKNASSHPKAGDL